MDSVCLPNQPTEFRIHDRDFLIPNLADIEEPDTTEIRSGQGLNTWVFLKPEFRSDPSFRELVPFLILSSSTLMLYPFYSC